MLTGVIGDVAGVLLYAGLVFVLRVLVAPRARSVVLGVATGVIGVGVELLQLTPIPSALAEAVPVARYVLGATFVASDLVAAMAGAVEAAFVDSAVRRHRGAGRPSD